MIIATGTASGKSLHYLVPAPSRGSSTGAPCSTCRPTKALAADQLRTLARPAARPGPGGDLRRRHPVRGARLDPGARELRPHQPGHAAPVAAAAPRPVGVVLAAARPWSSTSATATGASSAPTWRRSCAASAGSAPSTALRPVFLLASATASDPGTAATRLTGLPAAEVTEDASPRGATTFALWEPPLTDLRGETGAPVRRTATAETADLLPTSSSRACARSRSCAVRRAAETVADRAQAPGGGVAGAAGEGGCLSGRLSAEDRRALEKALRAGR